MMVPYTGDKYRAVPSGIWPATYDMLRGPNGFECLLTDFVSRTWTADGKPVVDELNRLQNEINSLKKQNQRLSHLAIKVGKCQSCKNDIASVPECKPKTTYTRVVGP